MDVRHTADLAPADRAAIEALLAAAFDDLTPEDVDHCWGGLHVLAWEGEALVAHAALVQRAVLAGGRPLRCGYVEGLAVRADRRRQGLGGEVMDELESAIWAAYDLGALGSTDAALGFYRGRGWEPWRGALRALTPGGPVDTPQERGGVLVLRASAPVDVDGELLLADVRRGDAW